MTRKTFEVAINGEVKTKKFAFNAARREIPNLVRGFGQVGDIWQMVDEKQTFDEYGLNRIATVMIWQNVKTGEQLSCTATMI
jgi:hypothetical protein